MIFTKTHVFQAAIRRRVTVRFRSEICVLALKRQEILLGSRYSVHSRGRINTSKTAHVKWLQEACKGRIDGAELARLF